MENIQINGQKIWGPPSDWTGPPPEHGTEIYVKNLPDDVNEIELFQLFSIVGRIYEVRLPVHWSGINRGYAFIRYTNISEADAAIKAFDLYEIRIGRALKIERSVDNTRLFLSCVPNDKTAEDIQNELQTVVDNVKKVYVYSTVENPLMFRGYAFVEFKSHRDAAIAKRILTPDVCFSLFEKKCVAAWANPLPFLNENILKTINILFMRNVSKEIKSTTIKKVIENFLGDNAIQKVKRLNDFAFITFKNHEYAKAALNIIQCNPDFLGDNKIQVEWAVPKEINNNSDIIGNDGEKNTNRLLKRLQVNSFINEKNNFERKKMFSNNGENDLNKSNLTDFQKFATENRKHSTKDFKMRKILKNSSNPVPDINQNRGSLTQSRNSLIEYKNLTTVEKNEIKNTTNMPFSLFGNDFSKNDYLTYSNFSKFAKINNYLRPKSDLEVLENKESIHNLQGEQCFENLMYPSSSSSDSSSASNYWNPNKNNTELVFAKKFSLNHNYFETHKFGGAHI